MYVIGHLLQVAFLIACIYMAVVSRRALNGFARSLVALLLLFIVHGLNDAFHFLGDDGNLLLTSMVVLLLTVDLYAFFRKRGLYAQWNEARRQRIAEFENQRKAAEARKAWDHDTPRRWL